MVKIAALGGIALVWWELTSESIKLGQKIIFSSLQECESCGQQYEEDVCESCGQYIDDEEIYDGEEKKCEDLRVKFAFEICI